ncbi:MAG: hypothetical protein A2583_04400 [Bdellovibrionales bacterium RIFOXYD1_FULL_53_11]|nr:MAG: hypothetical protein A2583_04400 [Bdellovibrionales bacterium RIFOXYD1_FULL_53_11]
MAGVAKQIAEKLMLSEKDTKSLMTECLGVEDKGGSKQPDKVADAQFKLPTSVFEHICEWWYLAILEYFETNQKDHSPLAISKRVGIPKHGVVFALMRLVEFGLIKKDPRRPGRYCKVAESQLITSETPNDALRKFHSQILDKAKEAIYTQTPNEKAVSSMTIAFDPADLQEIKRRWNEFRHSLEDFIEQGKNRSQVYTMIFELFALTNRESPGK